MRKHILYIFAFLTIISGCSDSLDFNPEAYYPSLSARYLKVSDKEFRCNSASSTTRNFEVISMDTPWGFSEVMDWITLSHLTGQQSTTVDMTVTEHTSADKERLGIFYLESKSNDWDYSIPLSVYQPAAYPYANPEETNLNCTGSTNNLEIKVSSNCTWTCSTDMNWLSAIKNNNTISISTTENRTNTSRSAKIDINYNGKKLATITITQKAANISLETDTLKFENTAGTYEIKLASEASWTATTSQNWLEVSPSSGDAGETTLKISAVPNNSISDRIGYIYFHIGENKVVEIPVYQRGIYIEFTEKDLSFNSEEAEKIIKINSNTSWTITSCPEWLSVSPTSGSGTQEITIRAKDNPNVTARTAKIIASQAGLSLSSELNINQAGKDFQFGSSDLECSDKEQEIKISITTTGQWSAQSNDTWISVSPTYMNGSSELILHILENTTDNSRVGTITLTIGDQSFTISVTQNGKYFTVNYGETQFGSTGAKLAIEISTNDSWNAKIENNSSWITLSKTNGTGNASFDAVIADNPSVNKRTSTIILTTANNKSLKIPIEQAARYLTVNHQCITFFAVGGTSEDITISTDGKYSITCPQSWISITEKGNTAFNVTASENTSKEIREGSITITLTDLKEGSYSLSIPVIQSADGASFTVIGYDKDKNWDLGANSSATFTVIGFGTDKNWDNNTINTSIIITITGFSEDKNWDTKNQSSGSVSYQGFNNDNNWDN